MSTLGTNGRFGNQIFQYFFLKLVEAKLGHDILTPKWLGNEFFNIPHTKKILEHLNCIQFKNASSVSDIPSLDLNRIEEIRKSKDLNAVDIAGYFQYHTQNLLEYQELFNQTFKIAPSLIEQVKRSLKPLKEEVQPLISIHFRAGDYLGYEKSGHHIFIPPSIDEITLKINQIYDQIKERRPVIHLASDDLTYASSLLLSKNIPHITSKDINLNGSEENALFIDFILITLADILLISNSSFSFASAMLNKQAKYFFRPRMGDRKYVAFEPWNDFVLRQKMRGLYV
jgi:hypothetical protein